MITVNFDRLNPKAGDRIIDIGCGDGRHISRAADYPGVYCIGTDIRKSDLQEAEKRLRFHEKMTGIRGKWSLISSDVASLPFCNRCFGILICSEVMEHVRREKEAVSEIARVTEPGGILAVSVPRTFPEIVCWLLSFQYRNEPGGHVRIYTRKRLISLFSKHGFVFRGSHFAHAFHTPFWWLKCLIGIDRTQVWPVKLYHRFLVWEMMKKPRFFERLEQILNPLMGKSLVCYFIKNP